MTRNTKVGLLVGLLFLVGMGVLLSRQVSSDPQQDRGDGLAKLLPVKAEPKPVTPRDEPMPLTGMRRDWSAGPVERTGPVPRLDVDEPIPPGRPDRAIAPAQPRGGSLVDGDPQSRSAGIGGPGPSPVDLPRAGLAATDSPPPPVPGPPMVDLGPGRIPMQGLPGGWTLHKVQVGENLGTISTKYYQTCKKLDVIYQANKDKLSDPHTIREGMELRIPPPAGVTPPAVASPSPPAGRAGVEPPASRFPPPGGSSYPLGSPLLERVGPRAAPSGAAVLAPPHPIGGSSGGTYRVKEGDTLTSIAAELLGDGERWRVLWQANKGVIEDPDQLTPGLIIRLPDTRVAMQN